jgi:hypothetical protein
MGLLQDPVLTGRATRSARRTKFVINGVEINHSSKAKIAPGEQAIFLRK